MEVEYKGASYEQFKDVNTLSAHLKTPFKEGVEYLLEAPLGYDKYEPSDCVSGNSRNGQKMIQLVFDTSRLHSEILLLGEPIYT